MIGRVAQATTEDVEAAVAAAREGFPAWRDLPASERGDILRRAAGLLEERRFDLAATMVFESAKPWHEADGDVCEAIDYLRYYAAQGERLSLPQPMGDVPGEENDYFHEGRGVTAVIAPWNFPLAIITGMSVGALAGGNAAILKPAAQSPIIAHSLVEILREAGVPDGVVQYVPGPGGEVGRALVEHPGVDNIAFTGSSAVGLGIIEAASRVREGQRNVKRVIAEMGGKNAIIIDDDADLDQAVQGVLTSAFGYAGQKCSACSRLIIVGSAYEEALERLKNAVASLVVGPPHDPATFVPPVIGADAREKIMGYIESGRAYATLLVQTDLGTQHSALGTGLLRPAHRFHRRPVGLTAGPRGDLRAGAQRVSRQGLCGGARNCDALGIRADRRRLLAQPSPHRCRPPRLPRRQPVHQPQDHRRHRRAPAVRWALDVRRRRESGRPRLRPPVHAAPSGHGEHDAPRLRA